MKVCEFTLCTEFKEFIEKLVEVFERDPIGDSPFLYRIDDEAYVFNYESYSFRIESNLMISVIMQSLGENRVKFNVFSGGGRQGILSLGFGAELSRIHLFMDKIMELIEENKWSLDSCDDDIKKYIDKRNHY